MVTYRYRAVSTDGAVRRGCLEAEGVAEAVDRLQSDGLMPVRLRRGGLSFLDHCGGHQPGRAVVERFTRELAVLLGAGLPLDDALRMLGSLGGDPPLRRLAAGIGERVRAGKPLSVALAGEGGTFAPVYLALVRAGEASGSLERAYMRLATYLERSRELRGALLSALLYPTILLLVAASSVIVLLLYVVPELALLFDGMEATLPTSTRGVIAAAELLRSHGAALAAATCVVLLSGRRLLYDESRRRRYDRQLLRLPIAGGLIARAETARLAHTLAVLLECGVRLPNALAIARDVLVNRHLRAALDDAVCGLKAGRGFAGPLAATRAFPEVALEMMRVGEEAGRLDAMLTRIATTYEADLQRTLRQALSILEPLLIVALGVLVVGIVFSLFAAVLGLNELVF